jgi:aminoglycoside/choline kinase family phosphotransferase
MSNPHAFLLAHPNGVTVTPLAGDASGRLYSRWRHPTFAPMIHMDARNDRPDGIADFVKIGTFLTDLGLSAPNILAQSKHELLLEDLGNDLFARVIKRDPKLETDLYLGATNVILRAQAAPPPKNLPSLTPNVMAAAVAPAFDFYLKEATGHADEAAKVANSHALETILSKLHPQNPSMLLRDYHAENLLWLPNRTGIARVGILDFQDAHLGHPAYDLASLLEDARRDVSENTRTEVLAHFLNESGQSSDAFYAGFHAQAAQRNLRILGVLTRLAVAQGKRKYLAFLPRVWEHLMRDLEHPLLAQIRQIITDTFPAPDKAILTRLEGPDA